MWLQFHSVSRCEWVSENQSVSQSGEQARAWSVRELCYGHPWTILVWSTRDYGSLRSNTLLVRWKKTKNVAILSSTRSEFCNGPLPLVHCQENVNSNFYIYSSNVRCCVPLQHLFWLFHFVNLYNLVCLLSQHRSVTTDIVRCTVFFFLSVSTSLHFKACVRRYR